MSELDSARYWLSWIERGSAIALFLVAIGVAYEFAANRFERPLRKQIDAAREEEITRLQNDTARLAKEVAEANARVAEAEARVEEARRAAAEANQKAEHERLERLKIQKKLAPRVLNDLQHDTLIKFFKLVAEGANADICSCTGTPEVAGITTQPLRLLSASGWTITLQPWLRSDRAVVGILIESDPADTASVIIADGLTQLLRNPGELLTVHERMTNRGQFDAPIRITVGTQPL
jgi:hypothetical protein